MASTNPFIEEPAEDEILQKLALVISNSLNIDPSEIDEDTFLDSLGADSLDFMQIAFDADDEFQVSLPERSILETAEQIFGPDILVQDGQLTLEGKRLLKERLPELDFEQMPDAITVDDVNHLLARVGNWVRMISRLRRQTPSRCPQCGEGLADPVAGRFRCRGCSAEVDVASGDEVNRRWVREYYEKVYLPSQPAAEKVGSTGE